MLRRFTKIFYSMLSCCVSFGCVCILTMTAAAFSLEDDANRSEFTVNSVTVCEVTQDDTALPATQDSAQWCCVNIDITASTWNLSPYTYTIESFSIKTSGMLQDEENAFVVLDEPVSYSRSAAQDFVLRVYLHVPPDAAAADLVSKLTFTAQGASKTFGTISEEMKMYLPKLDMETQSNYQIICNEKPAAKSAAGFFIVRLFPKR